MNNPAKTDYSKLDQPAILQFIFHPRPEEASAPIAENAKQITISIDENIIIGARFYHAGFDLPTILFFHGNGEIVADYDDIGLMYVDQGINFFPVDYRGYGRSTGTPTIENQLSDCHAILNFAQEYLHTNNYTGSLLVMGRSMGSASACELAQTNPHLTDGLIIESGFAYALPLLQRLGLPKSFIETIKDDPYQNVVKIENFTKPTLIIHAEHDQIIPFADGQALFDACPSPKKQFVKIPMADHNTIFYYGMEAYMKAIKEIILAAS
jgi:uncharacterized protein